MLALHLKLHLICSARNMGRYVAFMLKTNYQKWEYLFCLSGVQSLNLFSKFIFF